MVDISGPPDLFCPACCDDESYSTYRLRAHLMNEHTFTEDVCNEVSTQFINGYYDPTEFYKKVDKNTPVYICKFDR